MIEYLKFIDTLKIGVISHLINFKSLSYFRKDNVSLALWFSLLERHYNQNKNNNIEDILKNLQNINASRPKFFKIINNAIAKKYIIKEASTKDRRKTNIHLSKQSVEEFENWIYNLKNL